MKKIRTMALGLMAAVSIVAFAGTSFAATTLTGGAAEMDGHIALVSNTGDADAANDWSTVEFDVASGTTFADLTMLATDYNVTDDDCGGGSPRFSIEVGTGTTTKFIFAYLGDEPNYIDCPANTWVTSPDLLDSARAIDTSQLPGGTFYDTYAHATSTYGSYPVLGISLVVDAGWAMADGEQTVLVDNVVINDMTEDFAPEEEEPAPKPKDACKKGGWMTFTDPSFKNQGQCIKHMNLNR
ncbi:MAG TPA: hypothetical protein VFY28_01965 [Candidatus Paceibacterota bacterium]|nr:hypothetical protein [Candidatus Paceibacterota bacterium]